MLTFTRAQSDTLKMPVLPNCQHKPEPFCLLGFLTWALWTICLSALGLPKFSPSGGSAICLASSVQDWVERVWSPSLAPLTELRPSVEPHGRFMLIRKLLYRPSSSLLSFTSTVCRRGLLWRDDTSWSRASALSLWGKSGRESGSNGQTIS